VSQRIFRTVDAARAVLACLVLATGVLPVSAQLPFDPAAIDQLTPEQRQRALQALGGAGSNGAVASPDGRFRDQQLPPATTPGQSQTSANGVAVPGAAIGTGELPAAPGSTYVPPPGQVPGLVPGLSPGATVPGPGGLPPPPPEPEYGDIADLPLKPFGYELFTAGATTFAPATDIPVPADYIVGPGDSIRVQLFGNDNGNYSLLVGRDGQINFPKLGPVAVAGQRFERVREMLTERVGRELIGVQSSISLGELRSIRVFLLGDVRQPGSYTVSSLATITHLLFVGGGITEVGSLRRIELKRGGNRVQQLDLYNLLLDGDSGSDARLQPGDVVFVPPVGARVSAAGAVKRPAIYELDHETSLDEVITLAGGLEASVNTGTAQLERYEANRREIRQIDLARDADLAIEVRDGDFLRVGPVAAAIDDKVRIIGHVRYPGPYQWKPGYDLRSLLGTARIKPSDARAEAYLPLGLIERTDPATGVRGWHSFNVGTAVDPATPATPLNRDDRVVILTRDDVSYLDSREVRKVASGDFTGVEGCEALQLLAELANSERAARFLKAYSAESTKISATARTDADTDRCPPLFKAAPRALQYLLEESTAVYGEVRRPGLYPIARGTRLETLIASAGGLSNESDRANIEFVSYSEALATGQPRYRTLDLGQPDALAMAISPGDLFNFKPLYLGQEVGTARIQGEVRFPGSYGILRGERLSQLMKRAGGVTSNAYPYGAVFTRSSARIAERDSYARAATDLQEAMVTAVTSGALGKDASNSAQFLGTVIARLQSAEAVGRVVIEADPSILEARPEIDPIVEPGDLLVMPKRPISVTVIGQVLNPGSLAFAPGAGLRDYIERAGGYSQAADDDRVFVILPNGTAQKFKANFWNYKTQDIPPGSVIVVPRDAAPFNLVAFSERLFGLLSNLAISAAALATISRNN
jgi:polysaccharide export outer membrane protein